MKLERFVSSCLLPVGLGEAWEFFSDPRNLERITPPSLGIVQRRSAVFCHPPDAFKLECGKELGPITLAYETYGRLDERASRTLKFPTSE